MPDNRTTAREPSTMGLLVSGVVALLLLAAIVYFSERLDRFADTETDATAPVTTGSTEKDPAKDPANTQPAPVLAR